MTSGMAMDVPAASARKPWAARNRPTEGIGRHDRGFSSRRAGPVRRPRRGSYMLRWISPLALLALASAITSSAAAYPVAPALSLEKLSEEADVIVKVEAVSTEQVDDPSFDKVHGFRSAETKLRVVSVIQGKVDAETILFRHYDSEEKDGGHIYMPQWYHFEPGQAYILCADETEKPGVLRQLWKQHRLQEDQGLLRAANTRPHAGDTLKQVYWNELTGLLASGDSAQIEYAIHHLDLLSARSYDGHKDFERDKVLDVLQPLMQHNDWKVAELALRVIGSSNPYLSSDTSAFWLASVGKGHLPGIGAVSQPFTNSGGKRYWRQLAAIVDSDVPAAKRALALRALGRADEPAVFDKLLTWVKDDETAVRAAAIALLADFPEHADRNLLTRLAKDVSPEVRVSVAQAIGYGQMVDLVPLLGQLLDDADAKVSQAAAMSLLAFDLDDAEDTLRKHVDHPQFKPLFVNALAQKNAEEYLDELAKNIRERSEPENWWGGHVPWGVAFDTLLAYAQQQSPAGLKSTRMQPVLEALEHPADAGGRGPSYYTSSQPRDLYALYLARGMNERAKQFRARCKKAITYDIDYYFDMADANPQQYLPSK
jgi:hypothetical protein